MNLRDKIIIKAIEDGWSVIKINNTYTFSKKHYNIKEYFDINYLATFIKKYS
jgi:hypothetical protein